MINKENSVKKLSNKVVIIVVTNVDDDDFSIIFDNVKRQENVLVICDKGSVDGYKGNIKYITENLGNKENINNLIKKIKDWEIKNNKNIIGIIGLDEEYHYDISYNIAKEMKLDFYERNVLDASSNKYLQRVILNKANINVPKFELVKINNSNGNNKINFNKTKILFPNVVKVITGYASTHVYLNQNQEEYNQSIKKIIEDKNQDLIFSEHNFSNLEEKKSINPKEEIIVEEFIEGIEYSCNYMIENDEINNKKNVRIIRVTRKITKKEHFSFFHGFYLFNPTDFETLETFFKLDDLINLCKNLSNAININNGICMMDFIVRNKKIIVIETTTRPGISTFTDLIAKIYPYTSIDLYIAQKLKLNLNYKIPSNNGLILYITIDKNGIIEKFDTTKLKQIKGFLKECKYYTNGETITQDSNIPKLAGYVLFENVKFEEIEKYILKVNQNINIIIK